MKRLLIIFFTLLLFSCEKEPSLLKSLPDGFFEINKTHSLKKGDTVYTYTNKVSRLPNTAFSKFYLREHSDTYLPYFNVTINLSIDKKITIEGVEFFKDEIIAYLNDFIDLSAEGKPTLLHLNFDENLTIFDFIEFMTLIKPIENNTITINKNVYIYNINALPDCDCAL